MAYGLGKAAGRHATNATQGVIEGTLHAGVRHWGQIATLTLPDSVARESVPDSHTDAIHVGKLP